MVVPEPIDTSFFDPAQSDEATLPALGQPLVGTTQHSPSSSLFRFLSVFKFEDRKGVRIIPYPSSTRLHGFPFNLDYGIIDSR